MVYVCIKCGFSFNRFGEVESCPSCDKTDIRKATDKETEEFPRNSSE